jgi:hypothetical protein
MSEPTAREAFLTAMSKTLADEGKLIEAGWFSLQAAIMPADPPPVQIREMRLAFFAGAQHLFASIMTILEPGEEPTDADMARMGLIAAELQAFAEQLSRDARFAEGRPHRRRRPPEGLGR